MSLLSLGSDLYKQKLQGDIEANNQRMNKVNLQMSPAANVSSFNVNEHLPSHGLYLTMKTIRENEKLQIMNYIYENGHSCLFHYDFKNWRLMRYYYQVISFIVSLEELKKAINENLQTIYFSDEELMGFINFFKTPRMINFNY
jgi:hypothetical protein